MSSKDTKVAAAPETASNGDAPPVIGDWEWEEYGSFESKMDRLGGALGIVFCAVLLLAAYAAYETIEVDANAWFRVDYKWALTSCAGLGASLGVLLALRKSGLKKREGRTSLDFAKTMSIVSLNIVALIVSAAVFVWILDNWLQGTSSPRPDELYIGSTLGIALVMVSLGISGKGTMSDRIASGSLAALSTGVFLLPLMYGSDVTSEAGAIGPLYVVAAFATIGGGLVTLRTSRIRYRVEEPSRRFGVLLGVTVLVAAALAFFFDTQGETDVILRDIRWLLPPIATLAVSLLVMVDARSLGVSRSVDISFFTSLVSGICIAIPVFDVTGIITLDEFSWLYPLSFVPIPLCMLAAFGVGRNRAKVPMLSLVLSAMPALLFLVMWLGDVSGGRSPFDAAWGYLTVYSASFVLVVVSGLNPGPVIVKRDFVKLARFMRFVYVAVFVALAVISYLLGRTEMIDHAGYLQIALWLVPLLAGVFGSAAVLAASSLPQGGKPLLPVLGLSLASLGACVVLMIAFVMYGSLDLLDPNPGAASRYSPFACYMAVLFGLSLVSLSLGAARTESWEDLLLTTCTALLAPVAFYALSISSGESEIPSYGAFLAGAILLYLSSHLLYTAYSGALVTREKISINIRNMTRITKQVAKNPMGAIGIGILAFFVFIAIFGPSLAPENIDDPSGLGSFEPRLPQSPEHWMGTDSLGFDIFSQLLYGARTSMIVGITAAMIASVLGAAIGLYSGYVGGWKDEAIMRLNDVVLSIPWLVLMIIIAAYLGEINLLGIILIIGLTGWSATARLVRAQVLSLRERQFVERARAIGCSDGAIIRRHILPNSFPLVFANTILTVAVAILSEATLSFLRMRPNDVVTWGAMLSYAFDESAFYVGLHWWIIAPGLCIVLVVLGFTLIGFALDEILNPKLRKR
jgi:peptide/nickel transport system permease protein